MYVEHRVSFYWSDFDRHIYTCQHLDRRHPLAKICQLAWMNPCQDHVSAENLEHADLVDLV